MCQMLAECCVPEGFGVVGVDIRRDNIIDALQERKGQPKCERAFFLVADGTREPLRSGSFDLGCLASALHLVPVYERPFQLLELIRVLRPGGEGVLTGPNENFSGEEYIRWSIGHCPELFASGWDLSGLHRFVQAGMLIAELVRKRLDFRAPSTADLCTTLNDMGCSVICVDTWPGRSGSGRDFFTGVRFAVTEKAKKIARTFEKDGS
jgi:SAM-dependent methyltransferase